MLNLICLAPGLAAEQPSKADAIPAVLSPEKFEGKAAQGYAAAKQIPDICAKLFCYCGCDLTDSHCSLLDCFTCDHGVDCIICQDEAILALDMKKKGNSLAEIQKAIDTAFQKQYPWEKPSPALTKYRQSLGAKPDASSSKALIKTSSQAARDNSPRLATRPARRGSCCGHHGS